LNISTSAPPKTKQSHQYPLTLLAIFTILWLALAISPLDRHDWLLENALPLLSIPLLIATYRQLRFTNFAYTCIFVFAALHEIGAHYTYAKVPYDQWFQTLTGHSLDALLGLQRNSFDRLVHFLYGLLLFPVFWELFAAKVPARGFWRYLIPVTFLYSHAGLYEIIEWLAAEGFGGDLGVAYLGTQGDEWDAQKDMALAVAGTTLALVILLLWEHRNRSPNSLSTARDSRL
jgi:putative membrane protein